MNTSQSFLSWRKRLKEKIISSTMSCDRFTKECEQLQYVLERTIKHGESDSVLLIGFQGSGKTTILNHALDTIRQSGHEEFITVQLNGLIHTDDGLALKEIICQLHLQELEGDRVAGSFSDNLLFLLQSLRSGDRNTSKPVIFILDEFHLFCSHRNQTLLYNLFEAAQASWAPICVVGMTSRVDVTELLEKRVKSRFSHRSILLLPNPTKNERLQLFKMLLTFEITDSKMKNSFPLRWNENISSLCKDQSVQNVLEKQLFCDSDEKLFRSFLLLLLCKIPVSAELKNIKLTAEDIKECYELLTCDAKTTLLQGLSTLELCLVIAMTHQMELYDDEPFNFEMILNRYLKFVKQSNSVKLSERPVVLKAFERLQALELIIPLSGMAGRSGLKEYQMYNFLLTKSQVDSAVQSYVGLQTDIIQWANSSLN
uniref:Origin recognition complex subunit 4 n=1 Tax=Graphocephala atropunctata TaxID=36148 RepID=A0A1B6LXP6_9HEMI